MERGKNVRLQRKTGNISETVRDKAVGSIDHYRKSHTPFQMRWKSSTLDDTGGQYCNRNCRLWAVARLP